MERPSARAGTVFVGEDFDKETFMCPGTFSAHWESPDGQQYREGPRGLSAQEAIDWGREQADEVYILLGDSHTHHSAGVVHPQPSEDEDDDTPVWIDGTVVPRRRMRGHEYMDRTPDDPVIPWQVSVSHDLPGGDVQKFMDSFRAVLESDPAATEVNSTLERGKNGLRGDFEFVVEARTQPEAERRAESVDERARRAAWPMLGKLEGDMFAWSSMDHVHPVEAE